MVNIPIENIQTITENISISQKTINRFGKYETPDSLDYVINRNISDDSYEVIYVTEQQLNPILQVNSNPMSQEVMNHRFNHKGNRNLKVLSKELKIKKFRDISRITFGYDNFDDKSPRSQIVSLNMHNYIQPKIFDSSNGAIELKTINSIVVSNTTNIGKELKMIKGIYDTSKSYAENIKHPSKIIPIESGEFSNATYSIGYNHVLLIPVKNILHTPYKQIYKVCIWNDDKSFTHIQRDKQFILKQGYSKTNIKYKEDKSVSKDFLLNKITLTKLPLENKLSSMDAIYIPSSSNEIINGHVVQGVIEVTGQTHYNYSMQETQKGSAIDSENGYILPYGFKGEFHPTLILDVNATYINLQISHSKKVKSKWLDADEGDIKLTLSTSKTKIKGNKFTIKGENIEKIIKENFTLKGLISLNE